MPILINKTELLCFVLVHRAEKIKHKTRKLIKAAEAGRPALRPTNYTFLVLLFYVLFFRHDVRVRSNEAQVY